MDIREEVSTDLFLKLEVIGRRDGLRAKPTIQGLADILKSSLVDDAIISSCVDVADFADISNEDLLATLMAQCRIDVAVRGAFVSPGVKILHRLILERMEVKS